VALALLSVLLLCAAALQSSVVAGLDLAGGRPDVVLLVVLSWAILRGPSEGVVAGVLGGLALDSLSGAPFGLHTAILGLIGFSSGLGEGNLYRGSLPLFLGLAVLATLVYHVAVALGLGLLGQTPPGLGRFAQVAAPGALLNAALMPAVFWLVRRCVRWLHGWRQAEV